MSKGGPGGGGEVSSMEGFRLEIGSFFCPVPKVWALLTNHLFRPSLWGLSGGKAGAPWQHRLGTWLGSEVRDLSRVPRRC